MQEWDVIVVGVGNAGLCAAISAREKGARVLVLERAPEATRGGNSRFTAGAFRLAYRNGDELRKVMPDLSAEEEAQQFSEPYPPEDLAEDIARLSSYRSDPELLDHVANECLPAAAWLREHGVRFIPFPGWHGLKIQTSGGGPGLVDSLFSIANSLGVEIWYNARGLKLEFDGSSVRGIIVRRDGKDVSVSAPNVVLAAGGFEANAEWRARYLGKGWDQAKVRGTWCNTGDGIAMALDVGAQSKGHWTGAHSVAWDLNAPDFGDLRVGDLYQKHSYPLGIVVNVEGKRFLDEGADFHDYTYARYGEMILSQPRNMAWQVFDSKIAPSLRDEYRIREVSKITGDTLEQLGERIGEIDTAAFVQTVQEYNASIDQSRSFDPKIRDGRRADLPIPKSNWAQLIDEPPYYAFAVTCGITFTFGGVKVDTSNRVLGNDDKPIDGLYAVGEMASGLFFFNYPGGAGLVKGSVDGRTAGAHAASRS